MSLVYTAEPGGRLGGRLRVPGDKSISHRAVMLGALAEGSTEVSGFLNGEDCLRTMQAFRAMGVGIQQHDATTLTIHGAGLRGLKPPAKALDLGNSGTSMRLMAGILAGQAFDTVLTGDDSLRRRPMQRVTAPLAQMGARIEASGQGTAPLHIHGGRRLHGIDYAMPVASAQVKSCLLLAGLHAEGETAVTEPAPSRDHTERMLAGFGYALQRAGGRVSLRGGGRLQGCPVAVPGDISSAAFFMVGAAIVPGSELVIEHVGVNPTRTGVIDILRLMGAEITLLDAREAGGEPVADLRIRGGELRGIRIPEALVPLAIDEFPAIFVAAACAEGETVLTGAEELRVKESDRIAVMATGLRALGIEAEPTPDGIRIRGGALGGGRIDSHGDHRVAMSFAMAALRAGAPIVIEDCANVNTSFPGFAALAAQAGLRLQAA
jgi:3-phosphoshikimate 1-carboxyvinyltransferase